MTCFFGRMSKYKLHTQYICFIAYCTFQLVNTFSRGNVGIACRNMNPLHFPFGPQNHPYPYSVFASMNQDGTLDVTLSGSYQPYKGFLLQAVTDEDEVIGKFLAVPPTAKIHNCIHDASSVSHNSSELKQSLTFHWSSDGYVGPVTFRATVVESFSRHWKNIEASYVIAQLPLDEFDNEIQESNAEEVIETVTHQTDLNVTIKNET